MQTANKSRVVNYKAELRRIARSRWDGNIPPVRGPVEVKIGLYYLGRDEVDVDNVIKPILDQLNGLVYEDDIQIVEITCRKFALPVSDAIRLNAIGDVASGLRSREAFLHVRVDWGKCNGIPVGK